MQISKRKKQKLQSRIEKKISFGIFLSIRTELLFTSKSENKKISKEKDKPRNKDINPICDIIFNSPVTY